MSDDSNIFRRYWFSFISKLSGPWSSKDAKNAAMTGVGENLEQEMQALNLQNGNAQSIHVPGNQHQGIQDPFLQNQVIQAAGQQNQNQMAYQQQQNQAPGHQLQNLAPGQQLQNQAPGQQLQNLAPGQQLQNQAPGQQLQDQAAIQEQATPQKGPYCNRCLNTAAVIYEKGRTIHVGMCGHLICSFCCQTNLQCNRCQKEFQGLRVVPIKV